MVDDPFRGFRVFRALRALRAFLRRGRRVPVAAGLLAAVLATAAALLSADPFGGGPPPHRHRVQRHAVPFGAFLGSGADGVSRVAGFERWADAGPVTVGHTYLPGDSWADIEDGGDVIGPWADWVRARDGRMLVLNVPMSDRNEAGLGDGEVRSVLRDGADGRFDAHYRTLARRLVADGMEHAVLVLGWEMNGTTYTGRCAPDPAAWKAYWRRIVTAMRSVDGAAFQFDFAPNRGTDAIPWRECWPGDDVVDIVGMDSYDQPPGDAFEDYVDQPDGLQAQVDFAARHRKPVSYPEWGLWRHGDDPAFVAGMLRWIATHDVAYQTVTDYCPHGVYGGGDWGCGRNGKAARAFRTGMRDGPPPSAPPGRGAGAAGR